MLDKEDNTPVLICQPPSNHCVVPYLGATYNGKPR
jgi:hypothetical protein